MKFFLSLLLTIVLASCSGPPQKASQPNAVLLGKKISVLMTEPVPGTNFRQEQLNRLIWHWNEASPWFRKQLIGISNATPRPGSMGSMMDSLEDHLKTHSDIVLVIQPRKFVLAEASGSRNPNNRQGYNAIKDEAEFSISLVQTKPEMELGNFLINTQSGGVRKENLLEKAAYEIATRIGLGWELREN